MIASASGNNAEKTADAEIVLVHGLWMHGVVFALMRSRLHGQGFRTRAFSYPSLRKGLDDNSDALARFLAASCTRPTHLLTHSLGGLVTLRMMARHPSLPLARVVLMGSPVQGSRAAQLLSRFSPTAALLGRSLREWIQAPAPDGPLSAEVGVIAGNRGLGLGQLIPGIAHPHDGLVSIEETSLPGASDRITLKVSHSEMLVSSQCAEVAGRFFRSGRFAPLGE